MYRQIITELILIPRASCLLRPLGIPLCYEAEPAFLWLFLYLGWLPDVSTLTLVGTRRLISRKAGKTPLGSLTYFLKIFGKEQLRLYESLQTGCSAHPLSPGVPADVAEAAEALLAWGQTVASALREPPPQNLSRL